MIKVMTYDREETRLNSIQTLLSQFDSYYPVGGTQSFGKFMQDCRMLSPDVILVDSALCENPKDFRGQVLECRQENAPAVVMVLDSESARTVLELMTIGFEGYIHRDEKWDIIGQALEQVRKTKAYISPAIAYKLINSGHKTNHAASLTPKELLILSELAEGASYKMIAAKLQLSYFTVSTHIRNIYTKLGVHSISGALALARKKSLIN